MQREPIASAVFIDRLVDGKNLPTGPYDPQLIVHDLVDFRGRGPISGSRVVYSVQFAQRVDLRELHVKGTLDLNYCIFEKGLWLDDAEIEGTLGLDYIWTDSLNMNNAVVRGELRLNTARIKKPATFYNSVIEGSLDMRGMSAGLLLMRGLRIQGDLRLGCGPEGTKQLSRIGTIDAPNIEICGRVCAEGIGSKGISGTKPSGPELILRDAQIHGSVEIVPLVMPFTGVKEAEKKSIDYELEYPVTDDAKKIVWPILGTLNLSGAKIGGSVIVIGSTIHETLLLRNARVSGNVRLQRGLVYIEKESTDEKEYTTAMQGLQIGLLEATGVNIEGHFWVRAAKIVGFRDSQEYAGDVNLIGANCRGIVAFENFESERTEITGGLNLSAIRCSSDVRFVGVIIDKEINLISGEVGRLFFGHAKLTVSALHSNQDRLVAVVPCQAGRLLVKNTTIKGELHLSHLQILGSVSDYGRQGLVVEDCRIAGDLTLWKIGAFRDLDPREVEVKIRSWDFSAAVFGDLRIRRCRIDGSCVLTFVKVSGEIDLQDSSVGGDLQVDSTLTYNSLDSDKDLRNELKQLNPLNFQYRTTCCRFTMRMLCCERDIDLTGLKIIASHEEVLEFKEDEIGCLDAKYIEVKGDLTAYKENKKNVGMDPHIEIPGCLDLSYASIKHLVVSAHSFPAPGRPDGENAECDSEGLILKHAQIGTLEIPSSPYPKPIGLADIKVDTWDIKYSDGRRVEGYKELLFNDSYSRSTYGAVERSLRDQGHVEDANAIYRVMRDREWREYSESVSDSLRHKASENIFKFVGNVTKLLFKFILKAVPHYLYKASLQYGTATGGLFFAIIFIAAASFPVYKDPSNFEASSSFLAEQPTAFHYPHKLGGPPKHGQSPPASEWGTEEALAMLVHYHVPVAPILIRTDWEARSEGCLAYLGKSSCILAPEDFANIMQLLNLIFWPLLLTFWIRKLLRQ